MSIARAGWILYRHRVPQLYLVEVTLLATRNPRFDGALVNRVEQVAVYTQERTQRLGAVLQVAVEAGA